MLVLDEDHAVVEFFDTTPGFCDQKPLDFWVMTKLQESLDTSSLGTKSARSDRLTTCLNAASSALVLGFTGGAVSHILGDFFKGK